MNRMSDIIAGAKRALLIGLAIFGLLFLFLITGEAVADDCRIGDLNISPCYPPDKVHSVPLPGTLPLVAIGALWLWRRGRK